MGRFGRVERTLPPEVRVLMALLGPVTWEPFTQGDRLTLLGWGPPCLSAGALGSPCSCSPPGLALAGRERPASPWLLCGEPRRQNGAELLRQQVKRKETPRLGNSTCIACTQGCLKAQKKPQTCNLALPTSLLSILRSLISRGCGENRQTLYESLL